MARKTELSRCTNWPSWAKSAQTRVKWCFSSRWRMRRMRSFPSGLSRLQPRAKHESVGKAISPPERRISTACPIALGCGSTGWTSKYFAMGPACHAEAHDRESEGLERAPPRRPRGGARQPRTGTVRADHRRSRHRGRQLRRHRRHQRRRWPRRRSRERAAPEDRVLPHGGPAGVRGPGAGRATGCVRARRRGRLRPRHRRALPLHQGVRPPSPRAVCRPRGRRDAGRRLGCQARFGGGGVSSRPHVVVVGGGIVGSAIARRLSCAEPQPDVTLVEKEPGPGLHQTSRNSGVVHAGLYYAPGSAKATLSREGVRRLRQYCRERGLPYDEVGKLVIALDETEERRLRDIEARALANGVPGLRWLGAEALREVEPHAVGRAALHSPTTAITDFAVVATAMLDDARERGATVLTSFDVTAMSRRGARVDVRAADGREVSADRVVIAGGLHADRLAVLAGDGVSPQIVPFRGEYLQLSSSAAVLVRGLIYPVPDPRYPFLGVHLTKRVDGGVLLGPNAVLATAREGYRRRDVDPDVVRALASSAGFRAFARANVRTGLHEVVGSLSRHAFVERARRYVPAIRDRDVHRADSGVRAQAMDPDGSLVEDFRFSRVGPVLCIRNAPSPAATASLAIADMVVDQLELA